MVAYLDLGLSRRLEFICTRVLICTWDFLGGWSSNGEWMFLGNYECSHGRGVDVSWGLGVTHGSWGLGEGSWFLGSR